MERVVSATQARINLGKIIRQVLAGEVVIIEHLGKPAVVVLSVEEYRRLTAPRQQGWRETLAKILRLNSQMQAQPGGQVWSTPPAEIIQESREERDAQLDSLR